jgi:hypothetical protein
MSRKLFFAILGFAVLALTLFSFYNIYNSSDFSSTLPNSNLLDEVELRNSEKSNFITQDFYTVKSSSDKLNEKGFSTLPSDSVFLSNEVLVKYNKKQSTYPVRIEFLRGLPLASGDSSNSNSITGNAIAAEEKISDINDLASEFFINYESVLGIDKNNLVEKRRVEKNGFNYISYEQVYNNIPIKDSRVIFVEAENKLMLLDSNYLSGLDISIKPSISKTESENIAKQYTGINRIEENRLIIYNYLGTNNFSKAYLTYELEMPPKIIENKFTKLFVYIDASSGQVLDIIDKAIFASASGRIFGDVVNDHLGNQRETKMFPNEYIVGNNYESLGISDSSGSYNADVGNSDELVSILKGPYVNVLNDAQERAESRFSLPPLTNDINWSENDLSYKQEESNVFYHTNRIHDFFAKGEAPFNVNELDYPMEATVEISGSCNAYATGESINFYSPGGGCEALSLSSDVIYHEYTHNLVYNLAPRLSDVYFGETGNMNEGYADYYACSLNNNSCLSDNFFFDWDCLRSCENTKKYPQDYDPEPHSAAEIISGSFWDLREYTSTEIADTLALLALSYDPQTFSELADNMIISDDSFYGNADLTDGSPHGQEICTAFYVNHGVYSSYCYYNLPILGFIKSPNLISAQAKVNISGSVGGDKFSNYTLYYKRSSSGEHWIKIADGFSPVFEDVIYYNLDVSLLNEGVNYFKLIVYGNNGQSVEYRKEVYVDNIKISSPLDSDIIRTGDIIEIIGNITTDNSFKVEYSLDPDSLNWSSEGIILSHSPSLDIRDSLIATWDTSSFIDSGYYTLKISTVLLNGNENSEYLKVYFDKTLKEGWPVHINWFYGEDTWSDSVEGYNYGYRDGNSETLFYKSNNLEFPDSLFTSLSNISRKSLLPLRQNSYSSRNIYYWGGFFEPRTSDLDGDGKKEIIVLRGGYPPSILVYYSNGSLYFEKSFGTGDIPGGNLHMPLVGDLNNDGFGEIIVYSFQDSKIYAFSGKGNELWSLILSSNDLHPTMLMADLNNDGKKEIVFKSNDAYREKMHLISSDGILINEWFTPNVAWGGSIEGSPAIGNFDEDLDLEIVSASPAQGAGAMRDENGNFLGWNNTGVIYVYDIDGSVIEGWPRYTEGVIFSSPVVGDVNKDGKHEIIVSLMIGANLRSPDFPRGGVYVFDRNGNTVSSWPFQQGYGFWSTPAIGDTNKDGYLEISISNLNFQTFMLNNDAGILNGWPQYTAWADYYGSLMVDINNDNSIDVLTTAGGIYSCLRNNCGGVYAWNNDGSLIEGFPKVTEADAQAPALIDDIDADGKLELIASSNYDFQVSTGEWKHRGSLYVWELNASYDETKMPWPQFHQNSENTGLYGYESPRSQSKIVNNGNKDENGLLEIGVIKISSLAGDNCKVVWSGINYSGTHETSGLVSSATPKIDRRFVCNDGRFYECGWELSDSRLAIKAVNGQVVGSYQCNLSNATWMRVPLLNNKVYSGEITIPAKGLIKLDNGEDNLGNQQYPGFNNLNVTINEPGNYEVYAEFKGKNASFIFSVK